MKVPFLCTQCHTLLLVELQDEDAYKFTCEQGHESVVWLQNEKFELFFDSACLAMLDGYPREAAFELASSYERFLEFSIAIISSHLDVPADEYSQTWDEVASQSERQLGMFLAMWLLFTKRAAKPLENQWVRFRNQVIHRGHIPPRARVVAYGDRVLSFINAHLAVLKRVAGEAIQNRHVARAINASKAASPSRTSNVARVLPTMVAVVRSDRPASFTEALDEMKQVRHRLYENP